MRENICKYSQKKALAYYKQVWKPAKVSSNWFEMLHGTAPAATCFPASSSGHAFNTAIPYPTPHTACEAGEKFGNVLQAEHLFLLLYLH